MKPTSIPVSVLLAVLAIAPGLASSALADSVLRFEAQVSSLWGTWEATDRREAPPIVLEMGDTITGFLTFDPAVAFNSTNDWTQPGSIRLLLDGAELTTDRLSAYVMDDRRDNGGVCDCGYVGPVAPDQVMIGNDLVADPSLPPIDDRIEVTRYVDTAFGVFDRIPEEPNWIWQPTISLGGPTSVLDRDYYLPDDSATLNALTSRILEFGLAWAPTREPLIAFAAIKSLTVVPEPPAGILLVTGAALSAAKRRRTTCNSSKDRSVNVASI